METEVMKKKILLLFFLLSNIFVYSEDYKTKKIGNLSNTKDSIIIRKENEVAPQDDGTGNLISINDKGEIFIFNVDKSELFKIIDGISIEKYNSFSFEKASEKIFWNRNSYLAYGYMDYIHKYNFDNKLLFLVKGRDFFNNSIGYIVYLYYDEESDILFLKDSDEKLYSIVQPGMDDEENRKNFKNPEETLEYFKEGKIINNTNVRVTKEGYLFINEEFIYFGQQKIGNYVYQKMMNDYFLYNLNEPTEYFNIYYNTNEDEQFESSAVHPSGDIYILRMNWKTNTHNLYRIENTWDAEWREQWYEEHPDAN